MHAVSDAAVPCHGRCIAAHGRRSRSGALLRYLGSHLIFCRLAQYISERLQLPPDIAGVTLLAFASGAPDIFTQIAAINGGVCGQNMATTEHSAQTLWFTSSKQLDWVWAGVSK
jgi:Sodium/calcium exchanger protein